MENPENIFAILKYSTQSVPTWDDPLHQAVTPIPLFHEEGNSKTKEINTSTGETNLDLESSIVERHANPKRGPRVNYTEEEVPDDDDDDDDDFFYNECAEFYYGDCPVHGTFRP